MPFCGIFFLWFMGAVRDRIGESEDKFLSTVFLGSGLLFIAMVFAFSALFGALIEVAGLHNGNPPLDIWRLGRETTFNLASIYAVRMGAVFMIAASTIAFRLRIHSRVVAVVGYVAAVLLLFASTVDSLAPAGLPDLGAPGEHQHRHLVLPPCRLTRPNPRRP